MDELLHIMSRLRDPERGCPWDVEQDFSSIAPYTIEEAYEVAEAIERDNLDDLRDELGDLLFQVVFHAQMAREQGAFGFSEVVASVCDKMTRRHPHVFGDVRIEDANAQTEAWESAKTRERRARGLESLLDDVPKGMAELQRSVKLQKRAAKVGFDWPEAEQVFDKLGVGRLSGRTSSSAAGFGRPGSREARRGADRSHSRGLEHRPDDLGEADHGDGVGFGDLAVVELAHPLCELIDPPDTGIVVFDLAG
jgi:NTP pyrophosphatase (non-canonical NTP hydrolase)